jgi:hypothetical protein
MASRQRLERLIGHNDHFRIGVPAGPLAPRDHKEWHHFCVVGPELDLLMNLNLSGDASVGARPGEQVARVVVLALEHGRGWHGEVETVPTRDVEVRPGDVDLRVGSSTVRFGGGVFVVSIALQDHPVALRLCLRPRTMPLLVRNDLPIGTARVNWLVLPRLEATGTIVLGASVYRLERSPAYHDHNWGRWRWGQDFSWQWGFALPDDPEDPWAVVFERTTNRARSTDLERSVTLWHRGELHRVLSQTEVDVRPLGLLPPERVGLKVPRVMGLLMPERTTDIPERLVVTGVAGGDRLQLVFEPENVAQILIPNETNLGMTVINEAAGRVTLEGRVKGVTLASSGRGIFEFLV